MFENLTVTNSYSSKIKYLMVDGKPLTVEINNETTGICFSGTRDKLKLSLIDKKYPLNKLEMKVLFESRRHVSGKVKFSLYHHDNEIFLISSVETLIIGDEI